MRSATVTVTVYWPGESPAASQVVWLVRTPPLKLPLAALQMYVSGSSLGSDASILRSTRCPCPPGASSVAVQTAGLSPCGVTLGVQAISLTPGGRSLSFTMMVTWVELKA